MHQPSAAQPSPEPPQSRQSAWINFAGVVLAAMIMAGGGYWFGNVRGQEHAAVENPPRATETVTATVTVTAAPRSKAGGGSDDDSNGQPTGSVFYEGPVTIAQGGSDEMKDLDLDPPERTTNDIEGDLSVTSMDSESGRVVDWDNTSPIAEWTGDGVPNHGQCRQTALAGGGGEVSGVQHGSILCVETDQDRIARLEVTGIRPFEAITADAKIWEAA